MRRVTAAVLLSGVLVAAALAVTAVSLAAESGPRCADITGESHGPLFFWNSSTGQGTLNVQVATASGAACKQITYTLIVDGATTILNPQDLTKKGSATFTVNYTDSDPNLCISATTAGNGGHVHDSAPDTGCLPIQSGTPGGGSGFQ